MSLMIFAVWAVMLGGQFFCYLSAAEVEWKRGHSQIGNPQKNVSFLFPDLLPETCKQVHSEKNRTVATLSGGLEVLCDTKTDGGGWIVFQRRLSSDVDFYRNWVDYKKGFGDLKGNFWLGNENIHRLTFQRKHELRVDLTFNGTSYVAHYSSFRILSEASKYTIEVRDYSGNAGDSLINHNGMAFTTKDRDNDLYIENCAVVFHGAWWFKACHTSHLNGEWGAKKFAQGLPWNTTTTITASATSTEMKIRPLD